MSLPALPSTPESLVCKYASGNKLAVGPVAEGAKLLFHAQYIVVWILNNTNLELHCVGTFGWNGSSLHYLGPGGTIVGSLDVVHHTVSRLADGTWRFTREYFHSIVGGSYTSYLRCDAETKRITTRKVGSAYVNRYLFNETDSTDYGGEWGDAPIAFVLRPDENLATQYGWNWEHDINVAGGVVKVSPSGLCVWVRASGYPQKSTDRGKTFSNFPKNSESDANSCAISSNGEILVVVRRNSSSNLCVSSDGGDTWTLTTFGSPNFWQSASGGVVMSADGQHIYIGCANSRILHSHNYGVSWTHYNTGGGSSSFVSVACSVDGANAICTTSNGAAYRTSNSGTSWSSLSLNGSDPTTIQVSRLAYSSSGVLTVAGTGTSSSLWIKKSTDHGVTFGSRIRVAFLTSSDTTAYAKGLNDFCMSADGSKIFISATGTSDGEWGDEPCTVRSLDGGTTWEHSGRLAASYIGCSPTGQDIYQQNTGSTEEPNKGPSDDNSGLWINRAGGKRSTEIVEDEEYE